MAGRYKVAAKEDRTADGIVFDSKSEMLAYVNQFRPLMRSGIKVELQKPFKLFAYYNVDGEPGPCLTKIFVCTYEADFVVTEPNGDRRVYDVKGHLTEMYKLKKKLFNANYPHLRIVEL